MNDLTPYLSLFISRHTDFAIQRPDGSYARTGRALLPVEVHKHLAGGQTIGGYLISEHGTCIYAVNDADTEDGLLILRELQRRLALAGIVSYLELSRRGGHLWVFFTKPVPASLVRLWLLPYCPAGVEFYPKQNEGKGYGSLIRLPLGVHLKSGKRYPFVTWNGETFAPVASTLHASLSWLETIERVTVPDAATLAPAQPTCPQHDKNKSFSSFPSLRTTPTTKTIREWCAEQDPFTLIGRYVDLSSQGVGCCPFGWHHANGYDHHASFKVYTPGVPGGYCWYCHTWEQGGSVFDFLRYYRNVDARTLWTQIVAEKRTSHTTVQVTRGVLNTGPHCSVAHREDGAR